MEQLNLLVSGVQQIMWAKVFLFLENNRASFLSIGEDRPDKAWQRHLIRVSLDNAKLLVLPCGKSLSPHKFEFFKTQVERLLKTLCNELKAIYSEEVYSAFFIIKRRANSSIRALIPPSE